MNKISVGAFYTKDTPYAQVVEDYLIPSCNTQKLLYTVIETPNYHSWARNVAEKPAVIRRMLEWLEPDEILLFVDADARIMKSPDLLIGMGKEYDIGYHVLDWNSWYGYNNPNAVKELLTGTMFFRPTEQVKMLCEAWHNKAVASLQWEQKVLQDIIGYFHVSAFELPIEYCYINSRPGGLEPLVKCDPVIVHYQKSRELKKAIR